MSAPTRAIHGVLAAAIFASFVTVAVVPRRAGGVVADLAVFGGYRSIEPRLSIDVPYATFRLISADQQLAALQHNDPHLFSAAITGNQHNGLIHLFLGQRDAAITSLSDPVDLAAAYYMRGLQTGSFNDFGRSLQALTGAANSAAACFNRALILEQLGDNEAAAAEWRRYLALDPSSNWSAEARQHLERDNLPSKPQMWRVDKPRLIEAAVHGDMQRVRELVDRYPLGARHLIARELLPAWASASIGGSPLVADRNLLAAKRCASMVAERGEYLPLDAVRDIDAASPAQRKDLAQAYVEYIGGHNALDRAELDIVFAHAAAARQLGAASPALAAWIAEDEINARYQSYDHALARALIERTRQTYAAHRSQYIALFAIMDWLDGLMQVISGDVSEGLASYNRALEAYERLGEIEYQAAQQINFSYALGYLGEAERADIHLRRSLLLASNAEDPRRLYAILKIAADSAVKASAPVAAIAFRDRFIRLARTTGEPLRIADALVAGSSIRSRVGLRTEALRDVAEVRRLAAGISDFASRERLLADAGVAEAFATRTVDDRAAIGSLTDAIDRMRQLEMWIRLAQLLLERGRAHARLGDVAAAELDFRAGIEDLEQQRRAVRSSDQRIAFFDSAEEVFVELARLLLKRGNVEPAFDLLERSRSRELLDRSSRKMIAPMTAAEIRTRLEPNTTLVTQTLTKQTLITCVVTRDEVRAFEQTIAESDITSLLDVIRRGFRSTELPLPELRRLGGLLLDRVAPRPNGRIVFVPDQLLSSVPFAALRTAGGRFLVEEQTLLVAPSATLFVRSCDRSRALARQGEPSLFAVASPEQPEGFSDLPPLRRSEQEARKVAANYAHNRVVIASDRQQASLLAAARGYAIVHFAAHGFVDRRVPAHSALLIGASGRLTAADVEKADLSGVRLVVLGGCYTGVGKNQRSEGAMSLARSFMAASVPTVVGTVAPIEDEHAERLLAEFHRDYSHGQDAAEALRGAQLKILRGRSSNDADPSWAAFEVIGGACAPQREREEVAESWRSH